MCVVVRGVDDAGGVVAGAVVGASGVVAGAVVDAAAKLAEMASTKNRRNRRGMVLAAFKLLG